MRHHRVLPSLAPAAFLCLSLSLAGCGEDEPAPQAQPSDETSSSQPSTRPSTTAKADKETGAILSMSVSGGEVSPMGKTIDLSAGDVLTIRITSDRPGELHVHSSPEQYVDFGAGETRRRISIDKPGQVDVEEHDSGALVARLLVK